MKSATSNLVEPDPHLTIQAPSGLGIEKLAELWKRRELVWFFTLRDIKVRYKQTALGPVWVVVKPLATAGLFSLIFGMLAGLSSGEVPYPVYVFSGMLIWNLFSRSLSVASDSLRSNQALFTKVYFPRLVIPIAAVFGGLLDFLLGLIVLFVIMLLFGITPGWSVLMVPVFALLAIASGLGVGLWFSAMGIRYRDLIYSVQFVTQFWMWATPVAYSSALVLENELIANAWGGVFTWLFQINPGYVIVEGFRWSVLGSQASVVSPLSWIGVGIGIVLLLTGVLIFWRTESTFADIV
jgi:lipopolysaccharide transport system permease protein